MDIDSLLLVLSCPASDTSAGVPNILLSRPSIVFMIDRTSMGWIPVETVPLAGSDDRLNTRHRVFESASLPLSKRQRVGSESSESVSSESMVGLESIGMVSQSTLPSEDEILLQVREKIEKIPFVSW